MQTHFACYFVKWKTQHEKRKMEKHVIMKIIIEMRTFNKIIIQNNNFSSNIPWTGTFKKAFFFAFLQKYLCPKKNDVLFILNFSIQHDKIIFDSINEFVLCAELNFTMEKTVKLAHFHDQNWIMASANFLVSTAMQTTQTHSFFLSLSFQHFLN